MRYLVISDIHANVVAFDAVLADAEGQYDKVWCLGDVVGYGPHPNECVERLRNLDHLCIAGNHDWAVINKLDYEEFQPHARFVVSWTHKRLTKENYDYLYDLPLCRFMENDFTLVHGSPRHPIWEYITSAKMAQMSFNHFETLYCLVGHTHSPVFFIEADRPGDLCTDVSAEGDTFTHVLNGKRVIINPGSVGQPRDGDSRASYGILDTETMEFHINRVAYDINAVQETMKEHEFPLRLWTRLEFGY
ncbi:MAG: metallophosphoesterase family protein [Chloroflexota bacterium]